MPAAASSHVACNSALSFRLPAGSLPTKYHALLAFWLQAGTWPAPSQKLAMPVNNLPTTLLTSCVLTLLLAAGWNMACPFPGDLFAQFERLQGLFVSFNQFTVGGCLGGLTMMGLYWLICVGGLGWAAAGPACVLQPVHGVCLSVGACFMAG